MMTHEEPEFAIEKQLEDAIASVIRKMFENSGGSAVVLPGFGLDIAVFGQKDGTPIVRFFEVKAFSLHHGRCGIGNQRGEGNQIRLLFDDTTDAPRSPDQLKAVERSIRWILGDRSKTHGTARFAFFTCEKAQAAAAGGVRTGKQNNLRVSDFSGLWLTWPELLKEIELFLYGQE